MGCNATCTLSFSLSGNFCGDGEIQTEHEECDDGNSLNTDSCLEGCIRATCGDGYVWEAQEACDDGNLLNTDSCLSLEI